VGIDRPGLDFWPGLTIETYPRRGREKGPWPGLGLGLGLEPWSTLIVCLSPYVKTELSYHYHTGTYSDLRCT